MQKTRLQRRTYRCTVGLLSRNAFGVNGSFIAGVSLSVIGRPYDSK